MFSKQWRSIAVWPDTISVGNVAGKNESDDIHGSYETESRRMKYATLCSGIEGFGLGFDAVGMECVYQCEIDSSCQSVLHRHYPNVAKGADVNDEKTARDLIRLRPGLVAFGSPCQDLSVAGKRSGLAGQRSGLFFRCVELCFICEAPIVCWENVPGVFSSNNGLDFAAVLEAFTGYAPGVPSGGWKNTGVCVGPLYSVAWCVLDSQWFGVPQRRRRVFLVGCLGNRSGAYKILSLAESLPGNPAPSREAGAGVTYPVASCIGASGRGFERAGETRGQDPVVAVFGGNNTAGPIDVATACNAHGGTGRLDFESETFITQPIAAERDIAGTLCTPHTPNGHGARGPTLQDAASNLLVPVAFDTTQLTSPSNYSNPKLGDPCHPLAAAAHTPAIAYQCHGTNVGPMGALRQGNGNETGGVPFIFDPQGSGKQTNLSYNEETVGSLGTTKTPGVVTSMAVRRLTPRECERLQGFPEVVNQVELEACGDHRKNSVLVGIKSRKWHESAWNAEGNDASRYAFGVGSHSSTSHQSHESVAHVDVLISCGERGVGIRSELGQSWFVSGAEPRSRSLQLIESVDFAQHLVRLSQIAVKTIPDGKEGLQAREPHLIPPWSGSKHAWRCGDETTRLAKDAWSGFSTMAGPLTRFTTESHSMSSSLDLRFQTSFCYVIRAITGFIPKKTKTGNSLSLRITHRSGWTKYGHDGKQISDSARYRMLGNAVTVNVIEWIGKRILDPTGSDPAEWPEDLRNQP